jgi:hypothetical protein
MNFDYEGFLSDWAVSRAFDPLRACPGEIANQLNKYLSRSLLAQ